MDKLIGEPNLWLLVKKISVLLQRVQLPRQLRAPFSPAWPSPCQRPRSRRGWPTARWRWRCCTTTGGQEAPLVPHASFGEAKRPSSSCQHALPDQELLATVDAIRRQRCYPELREGRHMRAGGREHCHSALQASISQHQKPPNMGLSVVQSPQTALCVRRLAAINHISSLPRLMTW